MKTIKLLSLFFLISFQLFFPSPISPALAQSSPTLTRQNNQFLLNGAAISKFGLRATNALKDSTITNSLINNLDTMKAHGIQSVNISLQGAKTGNPTNAFSNDGTLKSDYKTRISSIMNALASRNMVGVVSFYYQERDQELTSPTHEAAVLKAAEEATNYLKTWRNSWFYVINEPFHSGLSDYLRGSSGQTAIYNKIKSLDSARLIYVSDSKNDGFTARTASTANNGNVVVEYQRKDEYNTPGVFDSGELDQAQTHAQSTQSGGGYWFWHAAWHQKADASGFPRFDKGGQGTSSSPGVAPVWNKMQELSGGGGPTNPPVSPSKSPTPPAGASPTKTPTPPVGGKPGDANNDNNVDGLDYVIWLNHYNQQATGAGNGDFNNSGKVDGLDYVIWLNNYGK